jgi:hypothetical protein
MPVYKHHVVVGGSARELEEALDLEGDYESLGAVMIDGKPALITRHRVLARMSPDMARIGLSEGSLPSY